MLYLILAILTSAAVSLAMRLGEKHAPNRLTMLAVNYALCTVLAALFTGGNLIASGEGAGTAWGLGALCGVLYLAGFLLLQWNVGVNGVVMSATFQKLGVVVPTVFAVTLFGEAVRWTKLTGVALAIGAILIINLQKGGRAKNSGALLLLMLSGGFSDTLSKLYEHYGRPEMESHFLLYTFLTAFVLCLALVLWKKQSVTWKDVGYGLMVGVPNYFVARFLLLSLSEVPAMAAYPTFSVGTIVVVALAGVAFFREKISRRQWIGMGVILASLVLLNL